MRLLLVEDNRTLAEWLAKTLLRSQYAVDSVYNGDDADFLLRTQTYDVVLLDLALPKMGGHDVLRRLRERGNSTPVLVLTANNTIRSRIHELDQGADDYVAKPFDVEELEARIRVLLRRSANVANPQVACADLVYSGATREFTLAGQALPLTPRERAVLEVLILKSGSTVSKAALANSLPSDEEGVSADAIEIYVHRLRRKLEGSRSTIVTLRGLGYVLRPVHDAA